MNKNKKNKSGAGNNFGSATLLRLLTIQVLDASAVATNTVKNPRRRERGQK